MAFVLPLPCLNRRPPASTSRCTRPPLFRFSHRARHAPAPRPTRRSLLCSHAPSPSLPDAAVRTVDPKTSSSLYVVGCVHGSQLSAADVRAVMAVANPDAVVLELCPARLVTLRSAIRRTPPSGRVSDVLRKRQRPTFAQARATFRGTPQAVLATLLESVYSLQALCGLDPGVEFAHPIRTLPLEQLICGDAPATDTVQAMYHAFTSPLKSLHVARAAVEAALRRGLSDRRSGVNVLRVLLGSRARVVEILRLLIPTFSVALTVTGVGSVVAVAAAHTLEGASVASSLTAQAASVTPGPLAVAVGLTIAQAFFLLYCGASAFHFMKVLIADRDTILARSVLDAAQYYSARRDRPVTIVTVVGLLHVNGIVRALQDDADTLTGGR